MELFQTYYQQKIGINVFLDGYLPNENVRFRDKKFSFDVSSSSTDIFQERK